MFKFFDVIINMLSTVVDLVVSFFQMIVYIFTFVGQGVVYLGTISAVLPAFVSAFVTVAVAYIVIITILNHGA